MHFAEVYRDSPHNGFGYLQQPELCTYSSVAPTMQNAVPQSKCCPHDVTSHGILTNLMRKMLQIVDNLHISYVLRRSELL